jgi:hypothetical protein
MVQVGSVKALNEGKGKRGLLVYSLWTINALDREAFVCEALTAVVLFMTLDNL